MNIFQFFTFVACLSGGLVCLRALVFAAFESAYLQGYEYYRFFSSRDHTADIYFPDLKNTGLQSSVYETRGSNQLNVNFATCALCTELLSIVPLICTSLIFN